MSQSSLHREALLRQFRLKLISSDGKSTAAMSCEANLSE
jgi:hypothetical protein